MSEMTDEWVRNRITDMEQILHRLHSAIYDKAVVDELYNAVYYDDSIPVEVSSCLIQFQQELNSFKQVFKDE